MLAECLGTEKWFALLGKPRGTVSRVIKEAVQRAGSEFTEEALTEVAQRISDGFVMGEQSEYSAYIRELMKAGLTEAEANAEAFKEFFIKNPLKAGATGAISAAMTGAGADIRNAAQIYGAGKQISNSPDAMNSLQEAAEDVLKQNYMGRNAEYSKGLQKDISNALEASANAKGKFGAAWNAGKARAGLAELYNTPKLSINSDTVFSDLRNEERNGAAQNKIETMKDGKKYVKADRQVIFTNNPDNWGKELEAYINDEIRRGQDVNIVTEDGDVLKITADTAWKIGDMHGWDEEAFPVKMDMGTHIDELAQVSRRVSTRDARDRSNKRFQPDKFEYRTAYFEDFNGDYYRVHISVGRDKNGKTIYSIGNDIKRRSSPGAYGSSANRRRSWSGAPSSNSIRENGEKYNSNFNQNNQWTFKRIAQLDNAVKKSGVNIIIEDIPQAEVEGNKVRQGAYYRNANTIVIDPRVSDVQIANTVLFHELAHSTEGTKYYDEFKNYIKGIKGADFITETERKMKSLGLSREEAESEAVADFVKDIFRGGTEEMNGFLARNYTAARELIDGMKNIIDGVKMRFGVEPSSVYERAVRSFEKALAKRETGGTEKVQNRIEYLNDGRSYVTPDREAIFTNNPEKWGEELEAYINDEIRHGRDVKLLADNGDILNITEDTAWKVGDMNGWNEKTFPIKMNMGTHIDELAEISKPNNVKDAGDRSDKRFQPDKFEHRTAYFRDYDNKYYRVHLSVGIDENGKTVYSIGNDIKEQEFPQANGSGSAAEVQRQSRSEGDGLSGATLNTIIRDADGKYNSNFNQEYRDENVKNSTGEVSAEEKARLIKEDRITEEGKSVKQQLEENADKLNSMEPVFVRNDISVQRGNRGDNLNWILKELGTKDIRVQREGVGEIILDSKRISNSLRYLKSDGELAAYTALPEVLKNGTIIDAINNHKGREYSTLTIGAPVVINEVRGNVAAVIKQDSGKNVYKVHRILLPDGSSFVYKKNESSAERAEVNTQNVPTRTPAVTAFNNSILENGEKHNSNFNQKYQDKNVKNSTREVSPEEKARLLREEEERRKEYGSKGGYEGHSMSRRAAEAYSSGEKPISKWTKSEILTGIEETARDNDIDIEGIDFSKLTTEELKSKFLRNSPWHHTGSFYNATDFYEISAAAVAETTREDIERIISGRTRRQLTNAERAEKAMNEKALEEAKEVYKKIKFIYNSGVTNYKSANTLFRRYANDDLDLDGLYKKAVKKTGRAEDAYKLERVSNNKGLATVKNRILEDYEAKGGAMLFETREDAVIKEKDIRNIQSIPRKSVNDFTSADIEKTETFARKYYNEMGNKSPFFRAWFGDWRENDTTPLKIADQKGSDRGITKNIDTGWDINVSGKVFSESNHKAPNNQRALPYLDYINSIVENAVLLDSYTIPEEKTKSNQSAMMHSLYAIADMGNGRELLKLYVEEINDVNQDGTIKRAYQLQNIQKAAPASVRVQGTPLSSLTNTGTAYINNISQLFAAVKRLDKNFQPRESSKVVNDDGTPRRMYYTTYHSFGTSDAGEILKRIDTQNLLTALQKINEEAIGDLAEAVELYNKVNNTDFDGIIKPTFMNNIIASAL